MLPAFAVIGLFVACGAVFLAWRRVLLREAALDRLFEPEAQEAAGATSGVTGGLTNDGVGSGRAAAGPLRRRWLWAPWATGAAAAAVVLLAFGWSALFAAAFGLIVAMLGAQLEAFLAGRRAAKIETQLADSLDLMIGALGAGSGVMQAFQAAIAESSPPVRGQLEEVVGRIRLGDNPQAVFRSLADRVPLETFLLFSSAMSVHWEVGGSLTPTLATVARTIRDRIEIGRRVQSNIAQSQLSTIFLLVLTYFIAAIVWRNNPQQMRAFVTTSVGQMFVAGSMVLQAVGMVWMAAISRVRF